MRGRCFSWKARSFVQAALARLDPVPQLLIDDPQLRDVLDDPGGLRIQPRDALSGVGVLDVGEAVPDEPADIELVVEDAGAALAVAVDRRLAPALARGAGDAGLVQRDGDRLRRLARRVVR